ncbi:23S rRNA (guanosine(2251)-2'-O)-methyltransferase RlmB [Mycoplasma buteonis]|uniref:23S rRNA (guanosine(2251)-2'-O)-methyltransferase RlmB n=1 Tax=Mycoplasma buteonis TaxID=171280 RepID=UPI00056BABED|nr:23S rRNA (guanosine(2251)-2'-O)-methyltransferase RlmB [Mycoplasma buteonis]
MKQLLMCGKNSVLEALANNLKVEKVYLLNEENAKYLPAKTSYEVKDLNFFRNLTKENHQGFLALIKPIETSDINLLIKKKPNAVLVLDHIQDPHNLGAIIRTANAAGIKDIILPKDNAADINSSTVLKISSGGFVGLSFYKVNSLSATITKLQKKGYWAYATTLDEKAVPHTDVKYNFPSLIVMGNEGTGVSKSVLSVIDQSVYIKQFGTVQSLNVSVATGIILFDFIKQQNE